VAAVSGRALHVHVADLGSVSEGRRLVRMIGREVGLSENDAERAAIVATEAGTNLVKHAHGGDLLVRPDPMHSGVVIVAMDRGPGMANFAECVRDGYTTVGTRGNGLGAIVRQSTEFDVYSRPGGGTILVSRLGQPRRKSNLCIDGLSVSKEGEHACGDNWGVRRGGSIHSVLVADGLGHGETAGLAADRAVAAFQAERDAPPAQMLERIHRALLQTRGAAVAVGRIDLGQGLLTYGGLGNIAATIEGSKPAKHLVSVHGTAGHQVRRLQEFSYPWAGDDILVMHSDGVSAHWTLDAYPGLRQRDPLTIAAVLLRDFSRGRDDATVVVAKHCSTE
jgi:anti-sigma regulatory factor (Ser/Thr protein kinase)